MQLSTRSVFVPFNAIRSPTWTFKVEAMTFSLSGTMAFCVGRLSIRSKKPAGEEFPGSGSASVTPAPSNEAQRLRGKVADGA